jgi:hypothetical protein
VGPGKKSLRNYILPSVGFELFTNTQQTWDGTRCKI